MAAFSSDHCITSRTFHIQRLWFIVEKKTQFTLNLIEVSKARDFLEEKKSIFESCLLKAFIHIRWCESHKRMHIFMFRLKFLWFKSLLSLSRHPKLDERNSKHTLSHHLKRKFTKYKQYYMENCTIFTFDTKSQPWKNKRGLHFYFVNCTRRKMLAENRDMTRFEDLKWFNGITLIVGVKLIISNVKNASGVAIKERSKSIWCASKTAFHWESTNIPSDVACRWQIFVLTQYECKLWKQQWSSGVGCWYLYDAKAYNWILLRRASYSWTKCSL